MQIEDYLIRLDCSRLCCLKLKLEMKITRKKMFFQLLFVVLSVFYVCELFGLLFWGQSQIKTICDSFTKKLQNWQQLYVNLFQVCMDLQLEGSFFINFCDPFLLLRLKGGIHSPFCIIIFEDHNFLPPLNACKAWLFYYSVIAHTLHKHVALSSRHRFLLHQKFFFMLIQIHLIMTFE